MIEAEVKTVKKEKDGSWTMSLKVKGIDKIGRVPEITTVVNDALLESTGQTKLEEES